MLPHQPYLLAMYLQGVVRILFFFFNDTATTEIYTLSLHDALPIYQGGRGLIAGVALVAKPAGPTSHDVVDQVRRALATRRVGHLGTLDPFAAGLLVGVVGRAAPLAPYAARRAQADEGGLPLGGTTSTHDTPGPTTAVSDA